MSSRDVTPRLALASVWTGVVLAVAAASSVTGDMGAGSVGLLAVPAAALIVLRMRSADACFTCREPGDAVRSSQKVTMRKDEDGAWSPVLTIEEECLSCGSRRSTERPFA